MHGLMMAHLFFQQMTIHVQWIRLSVDSEMCMHAETQSSKPGVLWARLNTGVQLPTSVTEKALLNVFTCHLLLS